MKEPTMTTTDKIRYLADKPTYDEQGRNATPRCKPQSVAAIRKLFAEMLESRKDVDRNDSEIADLLAKREQLVSERAHPDKIAEIISAISARQQLKAAYGAHARKGEVEFAAHYQATIGDLSLRGARVRKRASALRQFELIDQCEFPRGEGFQLHHVRESLEKITANWGPLSLLTPPGGSVYGTNAYTMPVETFAAYAERMARVEKAGKDDSKLLGVLRAEWRKA